MPPEHQLPVGTSSGQLTWLPGPVQEVFSDSTVGNPCPAHRVSHNTSAPQDCPTPRHPLQDLCLHVTSARQSLRLTSQPMASQRRALLPTGCEEQCHESRCLPGMGTPCPSHLFPPGPMSWLGCTCGPFAQTCLLHPVTCFSLPASPDPTSLRKAQMLTSGPSSVKRGTQDMHEPGTVRARQSTPRSPVTVRHRDET